jgi:hypothetical protein
MKPLPRIVTAEPVIHGVLKIVWNDGYEGVVDLRPVIDRGRIFDWLKEPNNFAQVMIAEFGHAVCWINDKGQGIDLSADNLREKAEKQAQLTRLAASMA